jgi:hypothetical protein
MDEVMLGRAASDAAAIPRLRSLLVARRGNLVAENYFGGADSSTVFDVRSVTKSVISMLTGIAIQGGHCRMSTRLWARTSMRRIRSTRTIEQSPCASC